MDRPAALADFEVARTEWEAAFARVPDAALTYLKPGDDYALGGLLVHVNWVLARYLRVLDGRVVLEHPPVTEDVRRGLTPRQRLEALQEMARLHAAVRSAVEGLDAAEWERKTPVVYGEGEAPYLTSPEDVLGWLRDHYREHVAQCADLIGEWSAPTATG
jgi:DinB superfamily